MRSILITGCNRGLGLGLVKQLVKTKFSPKYVIATCRNIENAKDFQEREPRAINDLHLASRLNQLGTCFSQLACLPRREHNKLETGALVKHLCFPEKFSNNSFTAFNIEGLKVALFGWMRKLTFQELREVAEKHKNIHILPLDVKNTGTFDQFANDVKCIVGEDGLNVLFNNAGYSPKSTRINFVKAEQLAETFAINTIGPIMLTKALLPVLKTAAANNADGALGSKKAAVINMTSILGSIAQNNDGGLYPYRCSKASINMATKSLSIDLIKDGILATCVHPGWVKTDMGGNGAPMTIDSSCCSLVQFVENLSEKHNGGFFQWDGKQLEW